MNRKRIAIVVAVVLALAVVGVIMAGPGTSVETTSVSTGTQADTVKTSQTPGIGAPTQKTPGVATSTVTTDTSNLVTKQQAFILLNPSTGTPGSSIGVSGAGFDPGSTVDISIKTSADAKPQPLGFAQVDKGGQFGGFSFNVPDNMLGGSFTIIATSHDGKKTTQAIGQVKGNTPVVKFGTQVGKPGDQVTFSAKGFLPGESVKIYFNSLDSDVVATLSADSAGGLDRGTVRVPYGAVGNNSFVFVGSKSQSPVTVQFMMLSLYPSVALNSFAAKADSVLTFTGSDFGPSEQVKVFLNSMGAPPVSVVNTDDSGAFNNAGGFLIPFALTGKNTFIFVGDKSQATTSTTFDVLPYTPSADPSTYGGRPGTSITFYGTGFARNEIVRVYVGKSQNSAGREVACYKTDDQGALISGGMSYTIQPNTQTGNMVFTLVGDKDKAAATASVNVMEASSPYQTSGVQDQKEYTCPFDLESQGTQNTATQPAPPASSAQPSGGQQNPPAPTQAAPRPTQAIAAPTPTVKR